MQVKAPGESLARLAFKQQRACWQCCFWCLMDQKDRKPGPMSFPVSRKNCTSTYLAEDSTSGLSNSNAHEGQSGNLIKQRVLQSAFCCCQVHAKPKCYQFLPSLKRSWKPRHFLAFKNGSHSLWSFKTLQAKQNPSAGWVECKWAVFTSFCLSFLFWLHDIYVVQKIFFNFLHRQVCLVLKVASGFLSHN